MAFRSSFENETKTVKLSQNQEFLRDIDVALRTRADSPWEVERLNMARKDVASRLTVEEIAEYEASRGVQAFDADKLAADLKEMDQNKDKNSI